ncbi:hypothetical protein U14_03025 [Candidatus Moduliflexus flocculans]|uniref:Putative restriction endonuclease domain-containing protein n=1 Tax=Candidatus Moduliflexus flocculans TaxID=1499966 RepID=A0A081BN13_9BACT|nr:hypothetical protein U14_03025 [Candidatus Moduliflexus flocculans]
MPTNVLEFARRVEHDSALQEGLSLLFEAIEAKTPSRRLSYAEFLEWADEDTLAEWENGEITMSSPASLIHQDIAGFLALILRVYVNAHELGTIISAPFQVKLPETGREPDLLFVRQEHADRLRPTYLDGAADVVVEIISPESLTRDRGAKFIEYEEAGIPEYWLIDPIRRWTECYQLGDERRYVTEFAGSSGLYRSAQIRDFWLRIEWLWQTPTLRLTDVMRELELM